jgi:chromosome partitioning protein
MSKIISFANSKGGVGKTTSTIAVGCCLAELGYKTLLIDLDHQGNLSDDFNRGDEDFTITDLFENPKFDINKIIYPALKQDELIENLFIIPADITLAIEARTAERFRYRLQILEDAIKKISRNYDFILIDCRPAIDLSIENAFLISDLIIIPVDMDRRAVKGINDLLEVVKEIKRDKPFEYTLVYTKIDKRNKVMFEATNDRINKKGYNILDTNISVSEKYKQSSEYKIPAPLLDKKGKPYIEYMKLTQELIQKYT